MLCSSIDNLRFQVLTASSTKMKSFLGYSVMYSRSRLERDYTVIHHRRLSSSVLVMSAPDTYWKARSHASLCSDKQGLPAMTRYKLWEMAENVWHHHHPFWLFYSNIPPLIASTRTPTTVCDEKHQSLIHTRACENVWLYAEQIIKSYMDIKITSTVDNLWMNNWELNVFKGCKKNATVHIMYLVF